MQKPALEAVAGLSQGRPSGLDWDALWTRHERTLAALKAERFRGATAGPLTLHLARASALENAGICLHPLFGFVYLPGTGLKGMARAYAETVAQAPKEQIEDVFGNTDHSGAVAFHDAWPLTWPRLIVDILNNHHVSYYQQGQAPGDWDSPVPVYFLAVPAGQAFVFALSRRRADHARDDLVALAREWLAGSLIYEGAGAKTATGYGLFKLDSDSEIANRTVETVATTWSAARQKQARAEFSCTAELTTPAFLAGANQERADECQLRPATIRGLLRWWWRTLHANHLDVATMARLEAAVWGDTAAGGAVRIAVEPVSEVVSLLYDKDSLSQKNGLPRPPNNKTTQGLWYHTFGMDDKRKEGSELRRRQRFYALPGAQWKIRLTARRSSLDTPGKQAGRAQDPPHRPGTTAATGPIRALASVSFWRHRIKVAERFWQSGDSRGT